MAERIRQRADSAPEHYPPLEMMPFVKYVHGKHVAIERFEPVLDENDVPDVRATLARLGEKLTYDSSYVASLDSSLVNVHHAVHSKSKYFKFGRTSYPVKHREAPDVKAEVVIPFHNMEHLIGLEPKMAKKDVMRQRGIESDIALRLYRLGSAALWLDEMSLQGAQTYRAAEAYLLKHGLRGYKNDPYGKRFLPSHGTFLDHIEHSKPGSMGILPDLELLASVELKDAVQILAEVAAKEAAVTVEESTAIIMEASRKATGYDLAA